MSKRQRVLIIPSICLGVMACSGLNVFPEKGIDSGEEPPVLVQPDDTGGELEKQQGKRGNP